MRLRNLFPLVLVLLALVSCSRERRFTVIGSFSNLPEQKVRLQELRINDTIVVVDSGRSSADGSFELSGESARPGLYQVVFEQGGYIILSLDKENARITGDYRDLNRYQVAGSPASSSVQKMLMVMNEHIRDIRTMDEVMRQMAAQGKDSQLAEAKQRMEGITLGLTQFVEHYADTTAYLPNALFAVRVLNPMAEEAYIEGFLQGLPRRFKNAPEVEEFATRWKQMMALRKGIPQKAEEQGDVSGPPVGSPAPEISLATPDGKTVTLSSYKGKYVLVDFWASWCVPCREENPNVVSAYKKFKDKNFSILGVSLDGNKDAWTKAIQADGLTWTHVSDLKKWESIPVRDYGLNAIPANVLVDPTGKIIARNLKGAALEAKLSEILQ